MTNGFQFEVIGWPYSQSGDAGILDVRACIVQISLYSCCSLLGNVELRPFFYFMCLFITLVFIY